MSRERVTIGFVGDIMIAREISNRSETLCPESFWHDVLPVLRSADGVIGNLECPLTEHPHAWNETWKAWRFRAHPRTVEILRTGNVRLVNLANNHLLDHQVPGLLETMQVLEDGGVEWVGAGRNAADAATPRICHFSGVPVGMIGITDRMPEFSAARGEPGSDYFPIRLDDRSIDGLRTRITAARELGARIVVLSIHWGPNYRRSPPGRFRRFARRAIDLGADVIYGHSAHMIQGIELYRGGVILYDTGGILDDYWVLPGFPIHWSFVFLVEFQCSRFSQLRLVPVRQERFSTRLARKTDADAIERRMQRLCRPLGVTLRRVAGALQVESVRC